VLLDVLEVLLEVLEVSLEVSEVLLVLFDVSVLSKTRCVWVNEMNNTNRMRERKKT